MSDYRPGEVAFLLGLKHRDALLDDASPRAVAFETDAALAPSAETRIPTTVRWREVHAARDRIVDEKRARAVGVGVGVGIVELRGQGLTVEEVAERVGLGHSAVQHRFHASLEEIVAALGGDAPASVVSRPSLCLGCGARPRARAVAVRRTAEGLWQAVEKERQLALCAACLPDDARERLVIRRQDVAAARQPVTEGKRPAGVRGTQAWRPGPAPVLGGD